MMPQPASHRRTWRRFRWTISRGGADIEWVDVLKIDAEGSDVEALEVRSFLFFSSFYFSFSLPLTTEVASDLLRTSLFSSRSLWCPA